MNREQKTDVVQDLRNNLSQSKGAFLVECQGLSVVQLQALRRELKKSGGTLQVAKARLMKIAASDVEGFEELVPLLKNQIGLVFASNDSSEVAKAIHGFSGKNTALKLVAGRMDSMFVDNATLMRVIALPSRNVLLAHLCGTLMAPVAGLARVLQRASEEKSKA